MLAVVNSSMALIVIASAFLLKVIGWVENVKTHLPMEMEEDKKQHEV